MGVIDKLEKSPNIFYNTTNSLLIKLTDGKKRETKITKQEN